MDDDPKPTAVKTVGARHGVPVPARWPIALAVSAVLLIGGAIGYRHLCLFQNPPAPATRVVRLASCPDILHSFNTRFSPDGNRIAFQRFGDKDYNEDIYVKQIGEEKALRLTTDPAWDEAPTWSPDGRFIAFHRSGNGKDGIYVIPALGGPERKLLASKHVFADAPMDWSPDGKYLAYVATGPGQSSGIHLLAVDTLTDKRLLTATGGYVTDYFPRFSPDGQTLAFVRFGEVRDILLVRVAGGEPKRLTFDDAMIWGLDWTPDEAYIIFLSDRQGRKPRLWKVSTSGGQPEPLPTPQDLGYEFSISHDGHKLAFTQPEYNVNIWRYEIPTKAGQSSAPTKLIGAADYNASAQFSPDGKRVAFLSSRSGNDEIWVCDRNGSNPRQLTSFHLSPDAPPDADPHWSPDGREIAFKASPENHAAIYVVSAEGGQPRRVTTDDPEVRAPSWSRDGKWIYFGSKRTGAWQVWKVPPHGGRAVQVTKKGGFAAVESPDGRTLYYTKKQQPPEYLKPKGLWKVPVEGGKETLVFKGLGAEGFERWDLTGEGIYFFYGYTNDIDFFNFATRKITQIAKLEKKGGPLAVSPDGRWILFSQVDVDMSHIMLVEDFRWQ